VTPAPSRPRLVAVTTDLRLTGSKRVLVDGACRVDRTRFDPHVLLLSPVPHDDPLLVELRGAGVTVHQVVVPSRLSPGGLARLTRWIRAEGRPDLFHTHGARSASVVRTARALVRGRRGLRVVVHFHGTVSHRATSATHRALDRWHARWTDFVLAPTANALALGRRAHALEGVPGLVIPNGVDLARCARPSRSRAAVRASWGVPLDACVVLLLGRWAATKGQDLLLDAAEEILAACPPAHLVFVGPEAEASWGARQVARLEALPSRARLHVHPADPDAASCLAAADLVAMPSRTEPFGLVAVEAMAAGVPLVASRVGGLLEVAGPQDTICWCEPGDAASLAGAVVTALAEAADAREARRVRALERAAAFGLARYLASLEAAYGDVLEAPPRVPSRS
jgi:glycosyltransferase involved in cell wall biosynthesis